MVATQDWHPEGHGSFASSHEGKTPGDMHELAGMPQVMWPDHCVQKTDGAEFHPALDLKPVEAVFRKGTDPAIVARINGAMRQVLQMPEIRARLEGTGNIVRLETPDQFRATVKANRAKWAEVIREANISID